MTGSSSQVAPRYLSGCHARVTISAGVSDTAPLTLPSKAWKGKAEPNNWDTSNAEDRGYYSEERGQRKFTFSMDVLWRAADTGPPVEAGGKYWVTLYPGHQTTMAYSGVAIFGSVSLNPDIKGDFWISLEGTFCGVYNTPNYPTAVADSLTNTGRFAPNYVEPGVTQTAAQTPAPPANGS